MLNAVSNTDYRKTIDVHQLSDFSFDKMVPGFIYHPKHVPLKIKRVWRLPELAQDEVKSGKSTLGLCFFSTKNHKPGALIELTISLLGEDHKFIGQVVIVKETHLGYETGIWLQSQMDAYRARIIEQVCYIDGYLGHKQDQSVAVINKEQGAREWISLNAAQFPA